MNFDISASAPGKILLLGGYAVVERPNISYAITVNARVHVRIRYLPDRAVVISAPQFGVSGHGTVDPKTGDLDIHLPENMAILKTAVEIPIKYLVGIGADIPGFQIEARNDVSFASGKIPGSDKVVKSGLGSSAGVTVAGIAAALAVSKHGAEAAKVDKDLVHKLAQLSHGVATGKVGSGFDIAAATYGSLVYTRYSPSLVDSLPKNYTCDDIVAAIKKPWDYKMETLDFPSVFDIVFANFLNESASTPSLVLKVKEFKEKNQEQYDELITQLNAANLSALSTLKTIDNTHDGGMFDKFKESFETGRTILKELGCLSGADIEPDDCSAIIEQSRKHGAFVAKLPGAGGKDAVVALTTDEKSKRNLINYLHSVNTLQVLDVKANNLGVLVGGNG